MLAQAVSIVNQAAFTPARRNGRSVDAWAEVEVPVRAPAGPATVALDPRCENADQAIRNAGNLCFDQRPAPLDAAPIATVPGACTREPSPATVLVRVDAYGRVVGQPEVRSASDCREFNQAALASAAAVTFEPALKSGQAVSAWTLLLVRPAASTAPRNVIW
jgi:hypothetical protein